MKKLVLGIIFFSLLLVGCTCTGNETIKVANWNLQVFGNAKESNPGLMDTYADIISDYDIVFVQEIRDKDGTAFPELCRLLVDYECANSSRAGRTSSKEQYGVIYKKGIGIEEFADFNPDPLDRWERPPVKVTFDVDGYVFTVYNIHIKPSDVSAELLSLENAVEQQGNVIVLGDLNADCRYYNPSAEEHFSDWVWVIRDDEDTTVASTDCAYDRVIMNQDAHQEYVSHGIYSKGITKEVSDHYLVWAEICPEE